MSNLFIPDNSFEDQGIGSNDLRQGGNFRLDPNNKILMGAEILLLCQDGVLMEMIRESPFEISSVVDIANTIEDNTINTYDGGYTHHHVQPPIQIPTDNKTLFAYAHITKWDNWGSIFGFSDSTGSDRFEMGKNDSGNLFFGESLAWQENHSAPVRLNEPVLFVAVSTTGGNHEVYQVSDTYGFETTSHAGGADSWAGLTHAPVGGSSFDLLSTRVVEGEIYYAGYLNRSMQSDEVIDLYTNPYQFLIKS